MTSEGEGYIQNFKYFSFLEFFTPSPIHLCVNVFYNGFLGVIEQPISSSNYIICSADCLVYIGIKKALKLVLATRLLLVKYYDNKMVESPG